jgi:hypothetical protein
VPMKLLGRDEVGRRCDLHCLVDSASAPCVLLDDALRPETPSLAVQSTSPQGSANEVYSPG